MTLQATITQNLTTVISPYFDTESKRQTIVYDALGDDSPDIRELSFEGETSAFIDDLIYYLEDKEAYPGRNALVAIVETIKRDVQAGQKRELDSLQRMLEAQLETRQYHPQPNQVFVSHATADDDIAVRIAHDLQNLGLTVWVDNDRLEGGHHWRSEIFRGLRQAETIVVLLSRQSVMRPWVQREVSSALVLNRQILPLQIDTDVFGAMKDHHVMGQITASQFIDLTRADDDSNYQAALDEIHRAILRRDERESPYRGLSSFEATDAEIYFGREQESHDIQQQMLRQSDHRMMIISGASGTGKISLMKAGVIGAFLKENEKRYNPAFANWRYNLITPGFDFLSTVAEKLIADTGLSLETIKTRLNEDALALHHLIDEIMQGTPATARYVLFIDQFEEVFRQSENAALMLDQLVQAAIVPDGRAMVVITIRSDFMHHLTAHPDIATILNRDTNLWHVAKMSRNNMRRTIEEPARRIGLLFEGDLVLQILDDANNETGSLPLLQYTLTLLYEKQDDLLVTYEEYNEIGSLQHALAKHAEAVYQKLGKRPKDQKVMRRLFLELVTMGQRDDGLAFTRKRRPLSEIIDNVLTGMDWSEDDVRVVIDYLLSVKARLLSMSQGNLSGSDSVTVVIAHETLLTRWDRLKSWLDENRAVLSQRNQYDRNVQQWHWLKYNDDTTATNQVAEKSPLDIFLGPAQQFIENPDSTIFLTDRYREYFIDAFAYPASDWIKSGRKRNYLLKEQDIKPLQSIIEQAQQDWYIPSILREYVTESEANIQRNHRIRLMAVSAIISLAVITSILAVFSYFTAQAEQVARQNAEIQRNIAVEQGQLALSRQLAVQSQLERINGDIESSLMLGLQAYDVAETGEALSSLLTTLQASPQLDRYLLNVNEEIRSIAYSASVNQLALGLSTGSIQFYDLTTQSLLSVSIEAHNDSVWDILYLNEGEQILTVGFDGWVRLWDVSSGEMLQEIARDEFGSMHTLAYSPTSSLIAFGGDDGTLYVWDSVSNDIHMIANEAGTIFGLAFNRDGSQLAVASADAVTVWETNRFDQPLAILDGHNNWVLDVAFATNDRVLAASSADNRITIWELESNTLISSLDNHTDWVREIEFTATGNLISASQDGTLIIWDMQDLSAIAPIASPMIGHENTIYQFVLLDDRHLVSVGDDGHVIQWYSEPQLALGELLESINDDRLMTSAINSQGNILVRAGIKSLYFSDSQTGTPIRDAIILENRISSIDFAPNSTEFVVGLDNGQVQRWDAATGQIIATYELQQQAIYDVEYLPDGEIIASAGESGIIYLLNIVTDETYSLIGHEDRVNALAFSSDGTKLASAGHDEQIRLWNVETGDLIATFERVHTRPINRLVFNPNGRTLYSGSRDFLIVAWDVETQTPSMTLSGHSGVISSLAIRSTGDFLISGSTDGDMILWATDNGQLIGRYASTLDSDVTSISFTNDESGVMTTYENGQTIIWDVDSTTWRIQACNIIGTYSDNQDLCI